MCIYIYMYYCTCSIKARLFVHEGKHRKARFCARRKTLKTTLAQYTKTLLLTVAAIRTDAIYWIQMSKQFSPALVWQLDQEAAPTTNRAEIGYGIPLIGSC